MMAQLIPLTAVPVHRAATGKCSTSAGVVPPSANQAADGVSQSIINIFGLPFAADGLEASFVFPPLPFAEDGAE